MSVFMCQVGCMQGIGHPIQFLFVIWLDGVICRILPGLVERISLSNRNYVGQRQTATSGNVNREQE